MYIVLRNAQICLVVMLPTSWRAKKTRVDDSTKTISPRNWVCRRERRHVDDDDVVVGRMDKHRRWRSVTLCSFLMCTVLRNTYIDMSASLRYSSPASLRSSVVRLASVLDDNNIDNHVCNLASIFQVRERYCVGAIHPPGKSISNFLVVFKQGKKTKKTLNCQLFKFPRVLQEGTKARQTLNCQLRVDVK
jgi:hypothetical protein